MESSLFARRPAHSAAQSATVIEKFGCTSNDPLDAATTIRSERNYALTMDRGALTAHALNRREGNRNASWDAKLWESTTDLARRSEHWCRGDAGRRCALGPGLIQAPSSFWHADRRRSRKPAGSLLRGILWRCVRSRPKATMTWVCGEIGSRLQARTRRQLRDNSWRNGHGVFSQSHSLADETLPVVHTRPVVSPSAMALRLHGDRFHTVLPR